MQASGLSLRPITDADLPFLMKVYALTRTAELAQVPWTEEEKQVFLGFQFSAQHSHYQKNYTTAAFNIIEHDGQPVGRLYVDEWAREIRIVDIALLPEFRGRGFGTQFLSEIQARAAAVGKTVSIHVERNNPAYSLYTRLGFIKTEENGFYDLLIWTSAPPTLIPTQGG